MSSLLALARKGKLSWHPQFRNGPALCERVLAIARDPACKQVNGQGVIDDLYISADKRWSEEACNYTDIAVPLTPPYRRLWLEGRWQTLNLACALTRLPNYPGIQFLTPEGDVVEGVDQAKWVVTGSLLAETQGIAGVVGEQMIWMDLGGRFIRSMRVSPSPDERTKGFLRIFSAFTVHSLARFNCANVGLVPVNPAEARAPRCRDRNPGIVWHTIVVRDIVSRHASQNQKSGECVEIRSHSVRGHYADYAKGSGLFGRLVCGRFFGYPSIGAAMKARAK